MPTSQATLDSDTDFLQGAKESLCGIGRRIADDAVTIATNESSIKRNVTYGVILGASVLLAPYLVAVVGANAMAAAALGGEKPKKRKKKATKKGAKKTRAL